MFGRVVNLTFFLLLKKPAMAVADIFYYSDIIDVL